MPQNDAEDVGQHRTHEDATEKYDAAAGTYKDTVNPVPTEDRLPTAQMPKGQDPMPFKLGPQTPGGR